MGPCRRATPLALLYVAALCAPAPALGGVFTLASLFGNGMTLQAGDSPTARVWGWADAGASVAVYQRGFNKSGGAWGRPTLAATATACGADGLWIAQLPPTPAGGPYRLEFYATTAAGASIANATLDWLWHGDVFLFSGQSNMCAEGRGAKAEETHARKEGKRKRRNRTPPNAALTLPNPLRRPPQGHSCVVRAWPE
jgi:hypothetical protein